MGRFIKTTNNFIKKSGIKRTVSGVLAIVMLISIFPCITLFTSFIGYNPIIIPYYYI